MLLEKKAARYGLLLGTALLNISWTFGHVYPDSYTYLRIAGYFLGEGEVTGLLVFRPLVPFLASLLSPVFGLEGGFAVVSSVFWLGTAVLLFEFARKLSGSEVVGFWAALLFNFSVPVLMAGAAVLTDVASWFFLILGLYLLAPWRRRPGVLRVGVAGLVVAVGILTRETVLALVVVEVLLVFSIGRDLGFGDLGRLAVFLFCSFLPLAVWTWYMGSSFWVYLEGGILGTLRAWSSPPAGLRHSWEAPLYGFLGIDPAVVPTHLMVALRFVVSISAAFHGALVLIAGRWRDSLVFFRNLRIWPLLVGTAAALVSRPFVERRLAFILFPVILLLAAAHLTKLATKGMLVVFALFVVGSYSIVLLFPGLLWWS